MVIFHKNSRDIEVYQKIHKTRRVPLYNYNSHVKIVKVFDDPIKEIEHPSTFSELMNVMITSVKMDIKYLQPTSHLDWKVLKNLLEIGFK